MSLIGVIARQSNGAQTQLSVTPLSRSVFSYAPVVAIVVDSEQGDYMGHMELSPAGAIALAESLIEAANAVGHKKEEDKA